MKNTITIDTAIADMIFSMTGFNYDHSSETIAEGVERITFDSDNDYMKFLTLIPMAVEDMIKIEQDKRYESAA